MVRGMRARAGFVMIGEVSGVSEVRCRPFVCIYLIHSLIPRMVMVGNVQDFKLHALRPFTLSSTGSGFSNARKSSSAYFIFIFYS